MHGIELKSGINNCFWNIVGYCTNYNVTKNKKQSEFSRDWDSKQNCTVTIIGVHKCSGYKPERK